MIVSEKSFKNLMSKVLFGTTLDEALESQTCVRCGKKVDEDMDFEDSRSQAEYNISGFCQECQDEIFSEVD